MNSKKCTYQAEARKTHYTLDTYPVMNMYLSEQVKRNLQKAERYLNTLNTNSI